MADTTMMVHVTLKSAQIVGRCSCGAGIADHRWTPDESLDTQRLAEFFTSEFRTHVERIKAQIPFGFAGIHEMHVGIEEPDLICELPAPRAVRMEAS